MVQRLFNQLEEQKKEVCSLKEEKEEQKKELCSLKEEQKKEVCSLKRELAELRKELDRQADASPSGAKKPRHV